MAKTSNKHILTGYDLVKGYVTENSNSNIMSEITPWQMVSKKDKNLSWIKWNADYFESLGIRQVKANAKNIIKNRKIAAGILDMSDYTVGSGEFSEMVGIVNSEESCDPLKQFYPVAPSVINVLVGEFIKREKDISVSCVDKYTKQEKFEEKEKIFTEIITSSAMAQKERALQALGVTSQNPETMDRYEQEMQFSAKAIDAEIKFRSYKHVMEEWGQHIINIETDRFKMEELEVEGFKESLTNSREYWHLDLLENDYRVEFLDSQHCFMHMSPNIKYIEDGDYFGWFEDMTVGDIINKLGQRLSSKDFDILAQILINYVNFANGAILLTEDQQTMHAPYYDTSKPYPLGATNIPMNNARADEYLNNFVKDNFKNASSVDDILNYYSSKNSSEGNPKIFKVMRCYFKSQRKLGWLTKIMKDGTMIPGSWVDEDYIVMDKPKYDNSIDKKQTKETLVYGEHIDWQQLNEWRHVIKINANDVHSFWVNNYENNYEPIYLDGERVKFQFKGKNDPFSCSPPLVGAQFRTKGIRPVSLIDLIKPGQIIHNICMNKVPQRILEDRGLQLAINKATVGRNNFGNTAMSDPLDSLLDNMTNNKIIDINIDRELISQLGNAGMMSPQVLNLSTINEAQMYFNLARYYKEEILETVGITRQRLGQQKAYESATGVENGISYSESQTEIYFNQHSNDLMPRLYQKMIEASQYYSSINKTSDLYYRNTMEQNEMLKIENMDHLLRDYNIFCYNKPNQRAIKNQLKQLFLQDNTLDATALEKAEVLIAKSNPQILEKLRVAQLRKEEKEQERFEAEQKQAEELRASQERMFQEKLANDNLQKKLDRESNEHIATLRGLSGMQTDSNSDGLIDAQQNLARLNLEREQMNSTNALNNSKLDLEAQKQTNEHSFKMAEIASKLAIANKKLAGDLVNKNKYDDSKLSGKVSEKNNISKK